MIMHLLILLVTSVSTSFGMENKILHHIQKEHPITLHLRNGAIEALHLADEEQYHGKETIYDRIQEQLRAGKKVIVIARSESHWETAGCFGKKLDKPIINYFDGYALAEWQQTQPLAPAHPKNRRINLDIVEYFSYDPTQPDVGFVFLCTQEEVKADNEKGKACRLLLNVKEKPKVDPKKIIDDPLMPLALRRHAVQVHRRASSTANTGFHATINSPLPVGNG